MEQYSTHSRVRLENFTVFKDATFEFCPGVNAIIGENGSGKTHLLKAMYAFQRTATRDVKGWADALAQLFQCEDITSIRRLGTSKRGISGVHGHFGDLEWHYIIEATASGKTEQSGFGNPVFLPAVDMMGHSKGFQQAYNTVMLDFDLSCYDIVNKFILQGRPRQEWRVAERGTDYAANSAERMGAPPQTIRQLLGGDLEADQTTGRFYLNTPAGKLEMPMIGEGLRKIASLVRLEDNNWLTPGSTLYWDEPEVNLNPKLMQGVVSEILRLTRSGVQVILTTHSYVILKELDLQASASDHVRFFSLKSAKSGTSVASADSLLDLNPNAIVDHYGTLYDRDLDIALGSNNRHGNL